MSGPDGSQNQRSKTELHDWLRIRLCDELQLPQEELKDDVPLVRYGMESQVAFAIVADLETWLGRPVSERLFWEAPSITEIVQFLQDE
ncbi:MAG: acyl carrier protein [Myxococcales bacterium]|nr:acyl carrier protein [Myxococcales bacterium]